MDVIDDKASLSDCDEDFHCVVCFELYKTPCLLDCNHTFCKNCCEGMSIKCHQASLLFCPLCRSITPWSKIRPLRVNSEIAQRVETMVALRNSQVVSRSAVLPEGITALLLQRLSRKQEPHDAPKIERLRKMIGKIVKAHGIQVAVSLKIGEAGVTSPLDGCKNVTIKLDDLFDIRCCTVEELDTSEDALLQLGVMQSLHGDTSTENIRVVLTLKGPRSSVKAAITELGRDVGAFQQELEDNLAKKNRGCCSCSFFRCWGCCGTG